MSIILYVLLGIIGVAVLFVLGIYGVIIAVGWVKQRIQ